MNKKNTSNVIDQSVVFLPAKDGLIEESKSPIHMELHRKGTMNSMNSINSFYDIEGFTPFHSHGSSHASAILDFEGEDGRKQRYLPYVKDLAQWAPELLIRRRSHVRQSEITRADIARIKSEDKKLQNPDTVLNADITDQRLQLSTDFYLAQVHQIMKTTGILA